jgi:phospholipid/cholesterol/gamma-HCH transport system substrate-binding protein
MQTFRLYLRHVLALAGIVVLALGVSAYISTHERLRLPWQSERKLYAEFSNAQAVTPGQGQTIDVAGVQVGEIGQVRLRDGLAVVEMDITSKDLGAVYRNAHLLLRPKTGLNDMSIALDPGTPDRSLPHDGALQDGDTLPVWNTLPAVNPDEVLAGLDADTRRYLAIVANAGGQGLRGRGPDLRRLIAASEPTFGYTRRVMRALADRRRKVARLVTNLRLLSEAAASKDRQLVSLVDGMTASFGAIAARDGDLDAAVAKLPGALGATDRALTSTRALSVDLRPALVQLRPMIRELNPALVDVRPLLREATPTVRDQLRPLVREATPLVKELRPSLVRVNRAEPPLERSVNVLTYVANELGYNPPGSEEGYLFWTAWFIHNAASLVSIEDAQGAAWRGLVIGSCSTFGQILASNPALAPIAQGPSCGSTGQAGSPLPPLPKRAKRGGH